MSFDLAVALRRIKPQRRAAAFSRRPSSDLTFVGGPLGRGVELLLDSCVYIDALQGKTPRDVDELLVTRILNHSTIALGELTHLFGRLDPGHPSTRPTLQRLGRTLERIPDHRLWAPSSRVAGEAGMLAGLAARVAGRTAEQALLNDAALLLHATEAACVLLTANIRDFDLLQQLSPSARVLFYQPV